MDEVQAAFKQFGIIAGCPKIRRNCDNNMPFAFLFGLGCFSSIFLFLVDMDKSRKECEAFITAEARRDAFAADSAPVVAVVEKN